MHPYLQRAAAEQPRDLGGAVGFAFKLVLIAFLVSVLAMSWGKRLLAADVSYDLKGVDLERHLKPGLVDPEAASTAEIPIVDAKDHGLIGGTVAPSGMFEASPWVGNCSATVIGERTLKTAAHCVINGGTKTFTTGANRYSAVCTHHPEYRRNSTADWALCFTNATVVGVTYETIATAEQVGCKVGLEFTWSGYGCTRWGGRIDGQFRYGTVTAIRCPSGTNYDTITRGSVALCSGDSGGGGYTSPGEDRKEVGTNSRSNTTDTSYVSSDYTPAFHEFATKWGDDKGTKICGVHADASPSCRGGGPGPDPDPQPAPECSDELALVAETAGAASAAAARNASAVASLQECFVEDRE